MTDTTIAKADEVSNNDNATFLNAVYEKGEYAQNTDDTLYASIKKFFGKISTVFTRSKLKFAYYWFLLGTDFTDFDDKKE